MNVQLLYQEDPNRLEFEATVVEKQQCVNFKRNQVDYLQLNRPYPYKMSLHFYG